MSDANSLARLETLALVAIGGFAGANLRFFALGHLPDVQAITLVNVLGSFVLGFIVYEAEFSGIIDRSSRLLFTTGFLSSLTTYSGFAAQTALGGDPLAVLAIVAGNYGLAFAGVLVGRALARRVDSGGVRS